MSRMPLHYLVEGVFALRTFAGEEDPQQVWKRLWRYPFSSLSAVTLSTRREIKQL
jgi:hypothetical protein